MNFRKLLAFADVRAALAELDRQPELWREITVRQEFEGTAHSDTEAIFLRGPSSAQSAFDEIPAYDYPAGAKLPACGNLVALLCEILRASEIGRVMVIKLKPGGHVSPHSDEGAYAEHYRRVHIVLLSDVGNLFRCGEESVYMPTGTAWWFDHRKEHEVWNASDTNRIHLIVDLVGAVC